MPLPAFKDRKAPPPAFTAEQAQDVYNFTRDQGQMIKGRNRNPKEQWWVYDNMKPSLAVANEEMVDELDSFVLRSAAPAPPYDIASKPFPMHDKRLDKSDDGWDSPVGKNKAQAKHNQFVRDSRGKAKEIKTQMKGLGTSIFGGAEHQHGSSWKHRYGLLGHVGESVLGKPVRSIAEEKRMKKDAEWGATFAPKYDEYCRREFERLTVKKGPRPPKLAQG